MSSIRQIGGIEIDVEKNVKYMTYARVDFDCLLAFNSYPMDSQECPIRMTSFNYQ